MALATRRRRNHERLVHHSDRGGQHLCVRYTNRLAESQIVASVGSKGDSYDNALAETTIGLYKTELIRNRGPWRDLDHTTFATLEYIDWFNHRRLHRGITPDSTYTTPAEHETNYHQTNPDHTTNRPNNQPSMKPAHGSVTGPPVSLGQRCDGGPMVRRMTPAQYNAWVRQENARQKRAIDAHNTRVRQEDARRKRAVGAYNTEVRRVNAHNERVRRDHNRKVDAHNRPSTGEQLSATDRGGEAQRHHQRSSHDLPQIGGDGDESFRRLEAEAESDKWSGSDDLLDLSESETANSVGTLNALLAEPSDNPATAEEVAALRADVHHQ